VRRIAPSSTGRHWRQPGLARPTRLRRECQTKQYSIDHEDDGTAIAIASRGYFYPNHCALCAPAVVEHFDASLPLALTESREKFMHLK
jgi:hypothetical protein